jgi:hypothetical protein
MTKQFEMYGEKFIPYKKENDIITAINTTNNDIVFIQNISQYKPKSINVSVEVNKPDKFGTIRLKSNDIIYIINDEGQIEVHINTLNRRVTYNKLNKEYFTCQ